MKNSRLKFIVFVCFFINLQVCADGQFMSLDTPPRGANILSEAGNCSIGPFGTIGDTGPYKGHCSKLTTVEKCVAYIKSNIQDNGRFAEPEDRAKATFCLEAIASRL